MEREQQKLYCQIIARLVLVDEEVSDEEHAFLEAQMDRFEFDDSARDEVLEGLDMTAPISTLAERLTAEAGKDLLEVLTAAAQADDRFDDRERALIAEVEQAIQGWIQRRMPVRGSSRPGWGGSRAMTPVQTRSPRLRAVSHWRGTTPGPAGRPARGQRDQRGSREARAPLLWIEGLTAGLAACVCDVGAAPVASRYTPARDSASRDPGAQALPHHHRSDPDGGSGLRHRRLYPARLGRDEPALSH